MTEGDRGRGAFPAATADMGPPRWVGRQTTKYFVSQSIGRSRPRVNLDLARCARRPAAPAPGLDHGPHATLDVVADRAHPPGRQSLRVLERPVIAHGAPHHRALVAAAHGDDPA